MKAIFKALLAILTAGFLWYVAVENRFTAMAGEDKRLETRIDAVGEAAKTDTAWILRDLNSIKGTLDRIEGKLDKR